MTFNTAIGSFNIREIDMATPAMVTIWTDAPVNSPLAAKHLKGLLRGKGGLGEIADVTPYEGKLVLTFDDVVTGEDQAKKLAVSYLRRLQTSVKGFDEIDLYQWRDAIDRQVTQIGNAFVMNNTAAETYSDG